MDQYALFEALKNRKIFGVGLDVFNKNETLRSGREDIIKLAKPPNVVATPLIVFNTFETQEGLGKELLENLEAIISNNPINIVN